MPSGLLALDYDGSLQVGVSVLSTRFRDVSRKVGTDEADRVIAVQFSPSVLIDERFSEKAVVQAASPLRRKADRVTRRIDRVQNHCLSRLAEPFPARFRNMVSLTIGKQAMSREAHAFFPIFSCIYNTGKPAPAVARVRRGAGMLSYALLRTATAVLRPWRILRAHLLHRAVVRLGDVLPFGSRAARTLRDQRANRSITLANPLLLGRLCVSLGEHGARKDHQRCRQNVADNLLHNLYSDSDAGCILASVVGGASR